MPLTLKKYRVSESYTSPKMRVDREKGIIYDVKILGIESKNGRTYSDQARKSAVPLTEGMAVAFGHDRDDPGRERDFDEQPAVIRNVRFESDGNYGDLHVFKSHALALLLFDRADAAPETFGLSHVAECELSQGDNPGSTVVENITKIHTLDIVTRPATTDGLFESLETQDEAPKVTTLFEAIKAGKYKGATRVLLEMDELEVDPMTVEMEGPSADPVEAVKMALAGKVQEIFLDDSIDPKETTKQIGELSKAAADVAGKLAGTAAAASDAEATEAEDDEEAGDEELTDEEKAAAALAAAAAAESTDPRLAALFARDESRSIVESNGMLWVDVPADVQKRMIAADDDAERQTIFESMTPAQQGAEKPAMPRGGNRASEDFDRETFIESLK